MKDKPPFKSPGTAKRGRVLEGSQVFGVKCGNVSELLWKGLKKGPFKTKNWIKGSAITFF